MAASPFAIMHVATISATRGEGREEGCEGSGVCGVRTGGEGFTTCKTRQPQTNQSLPSLRPSPPPPLSPTFSSLYCVLSSSSMYDIFNMLVCSFHFRAGRWLETRQCNRLSPLTMPGPKTLRPPPPYPPFPSHPPLYFASFL